jgi:cell division protein FtsQ
MSSIALSREASYRRREETKTRKFFLYLVLFLLSVLLLEILFHFFIAPRLMIHEILIETSETLDLENEEILAAGGIERMSSFFSVRSRLVKERLESIPAVKSAKVSKRFPHSLGITLISRSPIALLTIPVEDGLRTALVDEEGVVFKIEKAASADLPIISGIDIPRVEAGMKLPNVLLGFLEDLMRLREQSPALYRLISEIKFVKNDSTGYEVILYPTPYRVRVRIGPSIDKELLTYIMLVLDVLSGREMEDAVTEVDFRTEQVVYRVEGGE